MEVMAMKNIFAFTAAEIPTLNQVGGKALSLIKMKKQGMLVPDGIVLSVDFFTPWITILHDTEAWKDVTKRSGKDISKATKQLQDSCKKLQMTAEQQEELSTALEGLQARSADALFAVRSSSPEEDVEEASFAGVYETMLGVPVASTEDAIKKVFTDSLAERVFLYKKEQGFSLDQHRIAIIVQQQVDADSAGVAFSLNPINNCFDEGVIIANFGLGESVVGGQVTPDRFVVDKITKTILETRIGIKELKITLDPHGGTTTIEQPNNKGACLTPEQVLVLTDALNKIEAYFQKPIDIEWAFAKNQLYILQARPITTYLPLPNEMITAPGEPKILYADSTLIEQGIQEPLSVLGADFLVEVLREMTAFFGGDATGVDGIAFTAGGRYYMNLSNSIKLMGKNLSLAPGSIGDVSVKQIMDNMDFTQYTPKQLSKRLRKIKPRMMLSLLPAMVGAMKAGNNPEKFLSEYHELSIPQIQKIKGSTLNGLTIRQFARGLTANLSFFIAKYGLPTVVAPKMAQGRIEKIFKGEAGTFHDELASLSMSLPGNKTAEMGERMYKLASFADIGTGDTPEAFETNLRQKTLSTEFLHEWDAFVDEYGFRCFREIDVATPRPNEQPLLLYLQLKNLALAVKDRKGSTTVFEDARSKREAAYQTLYNAALRKGKKAAMTFEKSYKTLKALGGYRENGKYYITMVIDIFRKQILQKARLFVDANRLDTPDQIFDLTIDQIEHALHDSSVDLIALARENTVLIKKIKKSRLAPQLIDSRGKMFFPPQKDLKGGEISGEPISPGIVQGKVKVLNRADEKPLLPGEILVARSTDPGWTPLFINAKAIILEIGGVLQHGAVVAREYGIPCVSGIERATLRFKDGQTVEVDGSHGIIRLLSNPES